jgi:hypothetical protein
MFTLASLVLVSSVSSVLAAPHTVEDAARMLAPRTVTALSVAQLNAYTPYTQAGCSVCACLLFA